MSLVVNNNMMAANTARNLNAHYGRLATSTQRLSSGLRINSAADDAAGLAIRELQRADIAALHQGARNANDAISMIQVADGSLGIIDEKLIRMKELAEQAATGTYDSTQRLMIESEYQAMASEITRIANATDFNGTKLLDGTLAGDHDGSGMVSEGKMKIHFGTGNDSAEDYYYVEIDECTSEAFGLGNNSTWQDVQRRGVAAFKDSLIKQINEDTVLSDNEKASLLANVNTLTKDLEETLSNAVSPDIAWELWAGRGDGDPDPAKYDPADDEGFLQAGKNWPGSEALLNKFIAAGKGKLITANATGDIVALADDAVIQETVRKDGENRLDAIVEKFNDSIDGATAPSNITEAKAVFTTAIAVAKQEATTQGVAFDQALEDKLTALIPADDQLMNAAGDNFADGIKEQVAGEMKDVLNTDLAQPALDAAKANQKSIVVTAKVDEIADNIINEFLNEIDPTVPGITQTQVNAQIDAAIAAAIAQAGADGVNTANLSTWLNDTTRLTDLKNRVWDAGAGTPVTGGPDGSYLDQVTKYIHDAVAEWDVRADMTTAAETATKDELDAIDNTQLANSPATPGTPETPVNKDTTPVTTDTTTMAEFWGNLRETERQKLQYAFGQAAIYNLSHADPTNKPAQYGIYGDGLDYLDKFIPDSSDKAMQAANSILDKALNAMYDKVGHMNFAGHTVETQEDAQMALDAINEAIVSKDKIRAHLGAAQNRLENTVSNLNIQAENLQAAESRISDVDVATEMTQFVRNQILTQSAVAMLSQANSLPQMAMQLIGG